MKVMVTDNIETDLDLTNGARGEIVDIVLDPDEPPIGDDPIVHLTKLPAYILVKLSRTRATQRVKFQLPEGKLASGQFDVVNSQ
ncbi:hypothetical protein C8J57DRAFT_1360503 [Mycena rebaudengoi]|nr:hypothetical protein C8J57DRAFT_1360503 [Mycena rebaudengoi]